MKGTTSSGFEFEVAEELIIDNMELLEALTDLDAGDQRALVPVCRMILGEQKQALYDHVRTESGRVPMTEVLKEIWEILSFIKDGKKS